MIEKNPLDMYIYMFNGNNNTHLILSWAPQAEKLLSVSDLAIFPTS